MQDIVCRECVEEDGGKWDVASVMHLQEGFCPKLRDGETSVCETTGKGIEKKGEILILWSM
jgi:hypothetical protein